MIEMGIDKISPLKLYFISLIKIYITGGQPHGRTLKKTAAVFPGD